MSTIITDPERYFRDFVPERSDLLKEMEQEAEEKNIPIVGPVVGELLSLLAQISGAGKILELGTATGYSALFLARGMTASEGKVVTLESDSDRAESARGYIRRAGLERQIDVQCVDAMQYVESAQEEFDLIFLDIEKKDYLRVLRNCPHLIKQNGLLVADNAAFPDADPFNRAVFESPEWKSVHLLSFLPAHSPEKDAIALAVYIGS